MINKKRITLIIISILIVGLSLLLLSFNKHNNVVETKSGPIAIMLETEPGVYTKSQLNKWPTDDEYVYDSEKSYCVNGSTLIWSVGKLAINTKGSDKCYAYFKSIDSIPNKINERILDYNGGRKSIEGKGSPTFTAVEQENKDMYAMYDDYGLSYYFRGAVDNNWVKFGKDKDDNDIYWRIVRINGDGSVKLIYTGTTSPTETEKVVMLENTQAPYTKTQTTTKAFNTKYNKGEYIGYMYEETKHRGHKDDSTIKDFIDTWYEEHFLNTDYEEYLSDFVVCNDRGFPNNWEPIDLPTSSEGTQYSDVYRRLRTTDTPQLICPHKEDRYTVNDTIIGNGELTYPIGLLTADEATLAGGYRSTANRDYYLYTNSLYWLVSPYDVDAYSTNEFFVNSSGYVSSNYVFNAHGARPAVSLSSDTEMVGSGKWNDPYRLPPPPPLAEIILANNGGKEYIDNKTSPTFTAVEKNNMGMYAMEDDYTSTTGNNSYYFRGAVDNNWVKFGKEDNKDIWWRIVRINGDGSVKLIYTGTTGPQNNNDSVVITGVGTQIKVDNETTTAFNTKYNKGEYIGYMYEEEVHRGHKDDSTIKAYLDTWYEDNLQDYEEYLSDFVVCNDRGFQNNWEPVGLPSSSEGNQYSNAYGRNIPSSGASTPTLICPNQEDAYTKSDNIKGNAKLKHPIGLLTADEVTLAGAYKGTSNNAYYLYTNQYYWLVSPSSVFTSNAYGFRVYSTGTLGSYTVNHTRGVRPVVSLLSGISASGSGLWNDPYVVD